VAATIAVPVRTRNIIATDNAVWVTTEATSQDPIALLHIDPATNTIAARIPLQVDAIGLDISGPYLWVVGYSGDVFVLDTRTNAVVYHHLLLPPNIQRGGDRLTATEGSIWITTQQPGTLLRVNASPYT
jgi:hypothetical protein